MGAVVGVCVLGGGGDVRVGKLDGVTVKVGLAIFVLREDLVATKGLGKGFVAFHQHFFAQY